MKLHYCEIYICMHDLYARYCLEVNLKLPSSFAVLGSPVRIVSLHPPKVFGHLAQTLGKMLAAANLVACEYSSLSSLLAARDVS